MVRITRQPNGVVNGVSLRHYKPGRTYELDPLLADYLVLEGFAMIEMRRSQRSHRYRPNDRRRRPSIL
jgi:hypothetical protein